MRPVFSSGVLVSEKVREYQILGLSWEIVVRPAVALERMEPLQVCPVMSVEILLGRRPVARIVCDSTAP